MPRIYSQSGVALIIFLTIFVLGATALLLSELNNRTDSLLEAQARTGSALAQAKEALIGYAVSFVDREEDNRGLFGILPCPDRSKGSTPDEGIQDGTCAGRDKNTLGRLPWRTLGLPPLRDGAGECLWYAVSSVYKHHYYGYKDGIPRKMLNEDTNGAFEVFISDGQNERRLTELSPQDFAVAVIIAPGKILSTQNRQPVIGAEICGGNYKASNYLESLNVDSFPMIGSFKFLMAKDISAQNKNNPKPINDTIVYITRKELFGAIRRRTDFIEKMKLLTRTMASCMAQYIETHLPPPPPSGSVDLRLPWPAPIELNDYDLDTQYDDQTTDLFGRLPNIIDDSSQETGNSKNELVTDCTLINALDESDKQELLNLWTHWKDHLFYAVAEAHKPDVLPTPPCDALNCLQIEEDSSNYYAGVILFAGQALPDTDGKSQIRDTLDKQNITNYLEGENANGTNTYQQWAMSDTNGLYHMNDPNNINDILYCIRRNNNILEVELCPGSGIPNNNPSGSSGGTSPSGGTSTPTTP